MGQLLNTNRLACSAGRALALVLIGAGLAACSSMNPLSWYRDAAGVSKNDPSPDTRNSGNLEAGGKAPFPNLGTVPTAPTRVLSTEEREALTQSLVADRANARYTDEQLRYGQNATAAPPPRPANRPGPAVAAASAAAPTAPAAPPTAAAPAPSPPPAAIAASPPEPPPPAVSAPSAAPPPQASPTAAPPPPVAVAPPPAAAAAAPIPAAQEPRTAGRRPAQEAPPQESPLVAPSVRTSPEPETPSPAPPAPRIAPPATVAALPQANAPTPPAAAAPRAAAPLDEGAVAEVAFAEDSAMLGALERDRLRQIVPQHAGGVFRIVGHSPPPRGPDALAHLASFNIALDRANAVASALTEAGVPAAQIRVEAAPPAREAGPAGRRATVYVEP
jgi:outer membrane protein OmpA-like peptidoglycan-associated protein